MYCMFATRNTTYLTLKIQSASSSLTNPSIYTTKGSLFNTYTPLYLCSSQTNPFSGIFKLDKFLFPAYDAPVLPPPPSKFDIGAPAKIYAIAPRNTYWTSEEIEKECIIAMKKTKKRKKQLKACKRRKEVRS